MVGPAAFGWFAGGLCAWTPLRYLRVLPGPARLCFNLAVRFNNIAALTGREGVVSETGGYAATDGVEP